MNRDQIIARLGEIGDELEQLDVDSLDEQETVRFDELTSEAEELRALQVAIEERDAKRAAVRDAVESGRAAVVAGSDQGAPQHMRKVDPFDGEELRYMRPVEVRDRALAALDRPELTSHLEDRQKERVEQLLRGGKTRNFDPADLARRLVVSEDPEYRSAFQKMATQTVPALSPEESRALSRAASLNDTSGGFGVPVFIDPSIILTDQGSANPVMQIARVETITNDEWKGVNSAGVTWSFDAEGSEVSDDSPTLAQPTVEAHMARGFIPYSIEIGGDYPGFAQEMSVLLMEGYNELLAKKLVDGSGSGEPRGIKTALDANTNVEVVVTTNNAFAVEDIYKVWKELPERYRDSASWLMSVDVNNEVKQFGDDKLASQTKNLEAGAVDLLQGRPVFESAYMPDVSTDDNANLLIVGAFQNYLVAQRLGMSVELVPHLFGTTNGRPTGERGWFAYARVGGNSVNDLAFRILQNGS